MNAIEDFVKKTEKPIRMLRIYNVSTQVLSKTDLREIKELMLGIKPEIDGAILDKETKLEALYRAQVMYIHFLELTVDGLKKFYSSRLGNLREEIDDKILEIKALASQAKTVSVHTDIDPIT